ncbi:uracil-DNA glycosylase [Clostridium sp. YIM B02505]|uniref:Uracil-DNA glycosylase n=1 Tax=Clostridium yunnanense TaxID=2800325 RepID=A0ABS1ETK3_9CLOT|nr:uracil-DNA glycosylase [Clostridium yunnanense]MBK1812722.1 uracil-DNA glycosylase [Clostridium yunnanense]
MIDKLRDFVEELANTEVTPNVYNQYSYAFKESAIRRDNLSIYLQQMSKIKPKIILVGEAVGYRGSRLTGVPFTSEDLLVNNMKGLDLFGKEKGYRLLSEKDKLLKEATATIIWSTLVKYDLVMLAWNAFPFHPYKAGNEESNRTPIKRELQIGEKALVKIIEMFNIDQVVAMGNKAEESLSKLGINSIKVRHPAQGGKNQFEEGIKSIKEVMNEH